jgi:hypothetical protein
MSKFPRFLRSKFNKKQSSESIFGPLQITGEFEYTICEISQTDNELYTYIKNINKEINDIDIDINLKDAVFSRIIRIDLGHINPIIGFISMKIIRESYNITHISIHKSFRHQGLAKMLLMTLANYISLKINENSERSKLLEPVLLPCVVTSIIPENINDVIMLFRIQKFSEMKLYTNYHMFKPVKTFINIIDSPIYL